MHNCEDELKLVIKRLNNLGLNRESIKEFLNSRPIDLSDTPLNYIQWGLGYKVFQMIDLFELNREK